MKNIIILLACFVLWTTYANAEEVLPKDVFVISGAITHKHETDFRANQHNIKYLVLNSKGGGMQFAYNIMTMVSYLDIIAIVPKNGTCQSACTVIYQAAKRRIASEAATFVYHAVRFDSRHLYSWVRKCPERNAGCQLVFDQMQRDLVKETEKMFDALERFGMSKEVFRQLISRSMSTDPQWMQRGNLLRIRDLEYTATEALEHNIVTEIIPTSE